MGKGGSSYWLIPFRRGLAWSLAVSVWLGASATAAAPGDITNLGAHGGLLNSIGMGVNDAGQVAGYSFTPGDFGAVEGRAFRYTPGPGGGPATLEDVGFPASFATGINAAGQLAGYYNVNASGPAHGFLYTGAPGAGTFHDLGSLGGGTSYAYGINDAGQITGTATTAARPQDGSAYIYTGVPVAGGAMSELGPPGGDVSVGYAINNVGQVAGTMRLPNGFDAAFLYTGAPTGGGTMANLGTLGGNLSQAVGVNNLGQVVGYSRLAGNSSERAFLYSGTPGSGGTMTQLDTILGRNNYAEDINDAGVIVGWAPRPDFVTSASRALLWSNDAAHTLVDLDAWLDATNPAAGAQWTVLQATDISNSGIITGLGLFNDGSGARQRAFVLHGPTYVPEPGAAVVFAPLAVWALRRRRV